MMHEPLNMRHDMTIIIIICLMEYMCVNIFSVHFIFYNYNFSASNEMILSNRQRRKKVEEEEYRIQHQLGGYCLKNRYSHNGNRKLNDIMSAQYIVESCNVRTINFVRTHTSREEHLLIYV